MAKILIRDGRTKEAVWPDGKMGYPEVRISYRPALHKRVTDYYRTRSLDRNSTELTLAVTGIVKDHLSSWNIEQDDTTETLADITDANIALLPHPILNWMLDMILGYGPDKQVADIKN